MNSATRKIVKTIILEKENMFYTFLSFYSLKEIPEPYKLSILWILNGIVSNFMIRIKKKIHYVWILILTSLETYNFKNLMEQNISPVFYPSYKD